ncbi:MAG: DNA-binding domain-containing protein [Clostridium fessum]
MSNLAHLGIEDFMNETFTAYSSTLFPFEEIRAEMDHIRGKRRYGGKVSIKKFIDSLMLAVDREVGNGQICKNFQSVYHKLKKCYKILCFYDGSCSFLSGLQYYTLCEQEKK